MAAAPNSYAKTRRVFQVALTAGAVLLALLVLPGYYRDANARDNYAGVAAQLSETADPAADIVVINAPGQQDVWRYYDPGLPVLALPEQRPPDEEVTIQALAEATAGKQHAYGLFWATDESDPTRIVENWLDEHAFKSGDEWMGNLRFVSYTFAAALVCDETMTAMFGDRISLVQVCLPDSAQSVTPGGSVIASLHWITNEPLDAAYRVSVQVLDDSDIVLAQHDETPGGGARPTTGWQVGETIVDNHGVAIPENAEAGNYRMIIALYDPKTGQRLPVNGSDHLLIGEVEVGEP